MEVKELIRQCLLGEKDGQKLLYNKYIAPMARLCLRYIKDEDNVQDVLIDGFMKVFDHLKNFEYQGEHSLEIWIRKIMINQCLMRLRKNRGYSFIGIADERIVMEEMPDDTLSAEDIITLIKTLPEGYRTVFNLYAIDGYTHKEIADLLGITESGSRSQLTHARTKLKELLNKHGWK